MINFLTNSEQHKDDKPSAEDIRRFVEVYDSVMGCYPTPGTDMWRVRKWILKQAK